MHRYRSENGIEFQPNIYRERGGTYDERTVYAGSIKRTRSMVDHAHLAGRWRGVFRRDGSVSAWK